MTAPFPGTLEHWVRVKRDETALIEGDRRLSWADWNARADRLAAGLKARGVGPGDVVATRLQIRIEWPVLASAVGKLGGKLLIMNWRLTPVEARYQLENGGATAFFCDDVDPALLAPALDDLGLKLIVSVDEAAPGFVLFEDLFAIDAPALAAVSEAPMIVYTSGTTGTPKGVLSPPTRPTQESAEYFRDMAERRPQTAGEVMLVTLPLHHGAGPGLIRTATRAGTPMVLLRRYDPVEVLRLIEQYRITYWTGVPTMFKRIAALDPALIAGFDLSSIRTLGIGTAPATPALKAWIVEVFGDCLYEGYGSTESGMMTALSPDAARDRPGSAGRPYRHVSLQVRDDAGEVLRFGETGEIWAKTPVTIANYVGGGPLDDATLDADGYLRTGDIGHLDEDGYIFITDRAKDMIISGGVNVYPAEVEAAIVTHPAISDAAVFGIPDDEFGEQVRAVCELKPGHSVEADELIAHCARRLASHKRPRTIDFIEELPRSPIGKVLKRELRDPFWAGRERPI